jgi:hydrogenase maturation protease
LAESEPGRPAVPLVIGLGNDSRRDDGVGLEVARRLKDHAAGRCRVVTFDGEATALLDLWASEPTVVVVDAVRSGAPPGTVHRLEGERSFRFPPPAPGSTHGLSVAEAVILGRSLGQLPGRLVVFGVEGKDFSFGTGLTPAVERVVPEIVAAVVRELEPPPGTAHGGGRHA